MKVLAQMTTVEMRSTLNNPCVSCSNTTDRKGGDTVSPAISEK